MWQLDWGKTNVQTNGSLYEDEPLLSLRTILNEKARGEMKCGRNPEEMGVIASLLHSTYMCIHVIYNALLTHCSEAVRIVRQRTWETMKREFDRYDQISVHNVLHLMTFVTPAPISFNNTNSDTKIFTESYIGNLHTTWFGDFLCRF